MSSYLSTILTHTTSKYDSLRRTLTSSEADGDTDDDSHISRVLRAYYTEKHLPFPPWLPPDPKRAAPSFTSSLRAGNTAGGAGPAGMGAGGGMAGERGGMGQRGTSGLADLWNEPRGTSPAPSTMSLRRQGVERGASFRGVVDAAMAQSQSQAQSHAQSQSQSGSVRGGAGAGGAGLGAGTAGAGGARPLPSQRAGSYQSVVSQQQQAQQQQQGYSEPAGMSAGGGTAQERLKARLWGRAGSSTSLRADGGGQPLPDTYSSRDRYGGR